MENSLSIYGINGPLVTVKGKTDLKMSEMVYVGKEKAGRRSDPSFSGAGDDSGI